MSMDLACVLSWNQDIHMQGRFIQCFRRVFARRNTAYILHLLTMLQLNNNIHFADGIHVKW